MKTVKHSLQFVTELDETSPMAQRLLKLPEEMQTVLLEGLLKELIVPQLQPILDDANAHNSYATLKLA